MRETQLRRVRFDFFVRHLLGGNPPKWTDKERATQ